MSNDCTIVFGIWPCENETPGHDTHFIDDLTAKQQALLDAAICEWMEEQWTTTP
jgi:hypothetical protein